MCVTVARAHLSETIVLAAEARLNGRVAHVMGYQNTPVSRAGTNAMILPIPALMGTVRPEDFILAEDFRHVLEDMRTAITPVSRGMLVQETLGTPAAQTVVIFEHGIYTVVLAQDAEAIPDALPRVPEAKRPPLNRALFEAYAAWYPGWAIAVCCFNNAQASKAAPILLTYQPRFPETLFCPALDCHTGDVPDRSAKVAVDHAVVVSALGMKRGIPVRYQDEIPETVKQVLPETVSGGLFKRSLPNGDWCFAVEAVRRGTTLDYGRYAPPYLG